MRHGGLSSWKSLDEGRKRYLFAKNPSRRFQRIFRREKPAASAASGFAARESGLL
jgi:hypothetical protein